MFDHESRVTALADNYGLAMLVESNDIAEEYVINLLVDKGLINMNDYFFLDDEMEEWKRMEE